jgi:hypothetical protein
VLSPPAHHTPLTCSDKRDPTLPHLGSPHRRTQLWGSAGLPLPPSAEPPGLPTRTHVGLLGQPGGQCPLPDVLGRAGLEKQQEAQSPNPGPHPPAERRHFLWGQRPCRHLGRRGGEGKEGPSGWVGPASEAEVCRSARLLVPLSWVLGPCVLPSTCPLHEGQLRVIFSSPYILWSWMLW